ncbi:hypothetical protein Tco_1524619 [Tanacetum coccineum]
MKTELDDQSFQIEEDSDELEYPQELFSAVDLLVHLYTKEGKVSMVSFGRISPNRFLSSILLVVVTVVIVVVILVVVIFAIVEVVIVVVVFGVVVVVVDGVSLIF